MVIKIIYKSLGNRMFPIEYMLCMLMTCYIYTHVLIAKVSNLKNFLLYFLEPNKVRLPSE